MYGALALGYATSLGPDMGKAKVAAERIFKIIDYPSQINALDMKDDISKKKVNM